MLIVAIGAQRWRWRAVTAILAGVTILALLAQLFTVLVLEQRHVAARRRVRTGLEVLLTDRLDLIRGKRVGIITNPTGVLPDLRHGVDALATAEGVHVVAIFGPEHGFRGSAQAGGSEGSYVDERTGVPVYDLYGKNRDAIAQLFQNTGVEVVLFDIQDVGTRYYTYIWTMADALEAAALAGTEFIVLDRPNPTGGIQAEGPVLHPEYSSFVGRYPIAQRHGMTVGELALLFNDRFVPDRTGGRRAQLTVIPMQGWFRDMYYEETGLPWVMPSPNMPTVDTAMAYIGMGLMEGTNLSEGRGTTRPFELIGAPYIDWQLSHRLAHAKLPGVRFREAYFAPTFSKYAGRTIGGIQLYVTDRDEFDPIRTAITIIVETKRLYGDRFQWRSDFWIDRLTGSTQVRTAVDAGQSPEAIVAGWQDELAEFRALREQYLLYGLRGNGRYR
ncbi:DUF1343 domain-containing protein [Thermaerobacter sp. PB12/4term]|nr:DUF1343 domain-containing protein [Thermaerobacter sp. PB12/4term]